MPIFKIRSNKNIAHNFLFEKVPSSFKVTKNDVTSTQNKGAIFKYLKIVYC